MGFFDFLNPVIDVVKSWVTDVSKNHSSSVQTIYEPDKIQIAQLDKDKAAILVEGQKELIAINAKLQYAIIEAQNNSADHIANTLKSLMESVNAIAQQRLTLLENGHLEIVKKIETLYLEFENEIKKDQNTFNFEQLPQMLEMLEKFPKESSSHQLYKDNIEKQITINSDFVANKLKALGERQNELIHSSIHIKVTILEHSNQIVQERLQFFHAQLENRENLAIENANKEPKLLTDTSN